MRLDFEYTSDREQFFCRVELASRYENKRKLIDIHILTLYNLPPMSKESASELHALRNKVEKSLSAFKNMDRSSEDILNDILIYFIVQKLDPSMPRAWKLKCSTETSILKFEDLTRFISARALALEELMPLNSKSISLKANNATTSDASVPSCFLCKKSHFFSKCIQFVNKSPWQRRELVKSVKRCVNCLSAKHSLEDCQSKFSCRTCQQRHHSMLHVD